MKVNNILSFLLLAGGVLSASLSCTREGMDIPSREDTDCVPVCLSLSVAGMEAGTPETKAIMEPETEGVESLAQQVKNFTVLQFEGSGLDAKLVELPDYYKDAGKVFDGIEQVRLLPSSDDHPGPFIIVVAANTFDNIYAQKGMTLQQFLQMDYDRMADYDAVFTKVQEGAVSNDYLRMSGVGEVQRIDANTSVGIVLKRNVSKITINVTNTTGAGEDAGGIPVILKKAQLRDINAKYYYLTNIDSFQDNYSPADPYRFDKEAEDLPAPEADGSYKLTYYVPANLRGTNSSKAQYSKALGAPEGATRFCLYGTYGSDNTGINYTYYLGGDLVNDFNLKPNHHYTYNITLKSKGDARYDYRIEDCKEVKFKVDANCYMVQPPAGHGQERIYAIPIRRIATFWNDPGSNDGVYNASAGNLSYRISPDFEWKAKVVWSDFDLHEYFDNPSDFLTQKDGTGYKSDDACFKIKVKSGMKGNVVIAVMNRGVYFWSWHIWITDYNPDREALAPVAGTYVYGVEGGHVHRYNNAIFNSGEYRQGFIMDRNLGASGASYEGLNGTMYYQFGRKDPFPGYNQNGAFETYYTYADGISKEVTGITTVNRDATGQGAKNIRYSVWNPMTLILGNSRNLDSEWTLNDDLGGNQSIWLDNQYAGHTGDQQTLEKNKSIYDPCPPGWRVPRSAAFEHVKNMPSSSITKEGLTYNPVSGVSIFFPAHSYFDGDDTASGKGQLVTSSLNDTGFVASSDTTTASSGAQTYHATQTLRFKNNNAVVLGNYSQADAYPVRCVREEAYVKDNYIAE